MSTTRPAEGEHLIAYAYPASPAAVRNGLAHVGCYYVQTADSETPADSFDKALQHARKLGTAPQRWSMDHPMNVHFLPEGAMQ